ncbi:ABC transporter permease [Bradyrhizobium sp. WD16]|uniref:ABC transporter permease n=1 Tax=Bradyrhizobium sp. WD16 TaxID=1521768 RepID=UPI0020A60E01|nr:ABC transporter permease subunit [Bradyrhizobium sp. WD16]UTD29770.1 ABC transporter permease [Bradyrhizobium sp. WD16]
MALVTALYLIYLFTPIVLLLIGSFGENWFNTLLPNGFTADWYRQVATDGSFRRAFWTSLEVCLLTCGFGTLIGLPLAYAIYRAASQKVRAAARIVYLLPVAVPPLVLAFGFILVFSSDELPFLGSLWVLVGGHLVITLPYLLHTLIGDMRHLRLADQELAAESLGAGFAQRFRDVVLPALRHSLASGLITVAALSIGEFQLSNLVSGFLTRPYPVVLLQAFYGATGFACAATVVLLVLALTASGLSALTARSTQGLPGAAA